MNRGYYVNLCWPADIVRPADFSANHNRAIAFCLFFSTPSPATCWANKLDFIRRFFARSPNVRRTTTGHEPSQPPKIIQIKLKLSLTYGQFISILYKATGYKHTHTLNGETENDTKPGARNSPKIPHNSNVRIYTQPRQRRHNQPRCKLKDVPRASRNKSR